MLKETVYIIDAHNFLYRNYYALPKLTSPGGEEVGALYGLTKWLARLVGEKHPKYVAVCFDSPGGSKDRKEKFSAYKAHRKEIDDALKTQLNSARAFVETLGFKVFAQSGLEADDIMACVALSAAKEGFSAVLATSDKDVCQILDENIKLWPSGAFPQVLKGPEYVKEKFGVDKKFLLDYFAIVGDSSDNIPGMEGLGPKTAVALIEKYGHVEDIISAAEAGDKDLKDALKNKILKSKADGLLSKQLFAMDCAGFVFKPEDALYAPPGAQKLAEFFAGVGFKNMTNAFAAPEEEMAEGLFSQDAPGMDAAQIRALLKDQIFIYAEGETCILGLSAESFCVKKITSLTPDDKEFIKTVFENALIKKVSFDTKNTLRALELLPSELTNFFDLRLAAYTLNPSRDLSFTALSAELMNVAVKEKTERELLISINAAAFQMADILTKELAAQNQTAVYDGLELPLCGVLLNMETCGIKIDKKWFNHMGTMLERDIAALQLEINELARADINVNSPKQIGALLFETLKLPVGRKTKTGYSTGEDTLRELAPLHPVAQKILDYRASAKLKSAYVDNLLLMADAHERVHTHFDQCGTVTGRLASSTPNLQNIPVKTEKGRLIRKGFCAEEGNVLLALDYSQIDLRVLAHESGDEILVQSFLDGGDIHAKTAAEVFGVMKEMVSPEMRSHAKAVNFGIVYGQGPMGLSQTINVPLREAKAYIDSYFNTYKGVRKWIDENIVLARKNGFVKTLMGHVRYLPEFGLGSAQMSAFAERAAINTIVQGGSSDIIKKAMLDIFAAYKNTDVKMLLQVHDELIFEVPSARLKEISADIKHKMEHAAELKVPLLVELKAGKNWYETERV